MKFLHFSDDFPVKLLRLGHLNLGLLIFASCMLESDTIARCWLNRFAKLCVGLCG